MLVTSLELDGCAKIFKDALQFYFQSGSIEHLNLAFLEFLYGFDGDRVCERMRKDSILMLRKCHLELLRLVGVWLLDSRNPTSRYEVCIVY